MRSEQPNDQEKTQQTTGEARPKALVNVDLGRFLARAENRLGDVLRRATLGLYAVQRCDDGPVQMPNSFFHYLIGREPESSVQTRDEFSKWLVGLGLREGIEAVTLLCEESWRVLEISRRYKTVGHLTAPRKITDPIDLESAMDEILQPQLRKFEAAGLEEKLKIFARDFGVAPNWVDDILSINKMRACLTHREGRVSARDVNDLDDSQLIVSYRKLELLAEHPDGRREVLRGPMVLEAGGQVLVRPGTKKQKTFLLRASVSLDIEEFVDVITTLHLFSRDLFGKVQQHLISLGVTVTPADESGRDPAPFDE